MQMTLVQKPQCIYDTKERVSGLYSTLRNFRGKPTALLAVLSDLKDTFDNFSVCEGEPVRGLAYLLSDSAR